MNVERVNELGLTPLEMELKKIDDLDSKAAVWKHLGYLGTIGVDTPVGFFVSQDAGDATQYICQVIQSGTSLPDKGYYSKSDEASAKSRHALFNYAQTIFELAGVEGSYLAAEQLVAIETKLAGIAWERVELRDAKKRYNKMTLAELESLTDSKFDWKAYFVESAVASGPDVINVNTPSYFEGLVKIMDETSLESLKQYLKYKLIDAFAPVLSEPFVNANFKLYQEQLAGIPDQRPRWKRAVNAVSGRGGGDFGALGEAVGQLYVGQHFQPKAKAEMQTLVDNLLKAFGQSVDDLAWMTDETKAKAKEKLSKIVTKIGYPNVWRDYSKLDVAPDDLVGNVMRSNLVEHARNVEKLGKPIDREEWGMTPQTVNAYYNPSKNEIVFPAAILQPPFFGSSTPEPLNYGGIGAVIGHEISHAFDDQGSQYDGDGNLSNWWSDADRDAFKKLTTRLIDQYKAYEPLTGEFVNGELTLGENIADLSGLSIAHKAMAIARKDKPELKVAGWNADQLFFVGWSRVWQRKYRDSEMIKRLATDSHSPSQYRANGPVTNIDAFYEAFGVKEGDELFKPKSERIKIW
jgi:predicted metalloendopeptidase